MDLTGKITKIHKPALGGGSYADIYLANCTYDVFPSQKVALKVIRVQIYKNYNQHKITKVFRIRASEVYLH